MRLSKMTCKEAGYCHQKSRGKFTKDCSLFPGTKSRDCLICRYFLCNFIGSGLFADDPFIQTSRDEA
ncbi:unnamed protein product [Clavelina lepadiformis]|uniref:Uncharacterized protein n=1 Tax=Clavelina lepadiformis TaxID=159417 RepID=A0ABP0F046_CLALP